LRIGTRPGRAANRPLLNHRHPATHSFFSKM